MKSPLIAACLLGFTASPAFAASTAADSFELKINFDRSALDNANSLAKEYASIERQVTDRCEAEHSSFSPLRRSFAIKSCVYRTMERTVQNINHAGLTAFHAKSRNS